MTVYQEQVLNKLSEMCRGRLETGKVGWVTPTELGGALGIPYHTASSKMCCVLKSLVKQGKVERCSLSPYKGTYRPI